MSRHPDRDVTAELAQWALDRAPELVARAEAEAVAVLRDALVTAGLRGIRRDSETTPEPSPAAAPEPAIPAPPDAPDLAWAYCVLRDTDPVPPGIAGITDSPVERVAAEGLAALISRVPATEFAAEPLTRNLNDLTWLERVARSHEAVLDAALAQGTIVPLRMCTLFEGEAGVREMLERQREALTEALAALEGRLEWAVKVLVDRHRLMEAARPEDRGIAERAPSGDGGAYLQRRRGERSAREAAGRLAAETAQQIHARLQDWTIDARTRPPQNRELSGHEGEMVLNAAYLVERERTDELRQLVTELEEHHRELGARIELTGPWPPYNFVAADEKAAPA